MRQGEDDQDPTGEDRAGGCAAPIAMQGVHDAVLRAFRALPRGRVLDAGCGQGALSASLRDLGWQVQACDYGDGFQVPGIPFQTADLCTHLPYDDAVFDAVAFVEVYEHLYDPCTALREIARVLKPGGVLVLSTPNVGNLEARLMYLFTGNLVRPKPFHMTSQRQVFLEAQGAPHITPMNLPIALYFLESLGLRVETIDTEKLKPRQLLLAPLWLLLKLHALLASRKVRVWYRLRETTAWRVALGGNAILLTARMDASGLAPIPSELPSTSKHDPSGRVRGN